MADDISRTLEDIAKTIDSLDKKSKSLVDTDARAAIQLTRLTATYRQLATSMQKRQDLEKQIAQQMKANGQASEETMKAYQEQEKLEKESRDSILETQRIQAKAYADKRKAQLQANEDHEEYWRKYTKLGKAFSALSGPLAKLAAGLSFGALAMKALKKEAEAADLRSKLLIQSFQGLDKANLGTATKEVFALNEALVDTQATAIHFGKSAEEAQTTMLAFGRIVGTKNPEQLKTLSKAAIAVSASLGMDTAEAVDFVNTRMQKFGGTATSAILTLNKMREGSESLNNGFGRLVLRGDDLARTVGEISKNDQIYVVDQEYVGQVVKDSAARLAALGESYDTALKRAKLFAEGTTDKMPEWMKITTGASLLEGMNKAFKKGAADGGKTFQEQFGKKLDAAKPGLSKKIAGILNSNMSEYSKSREIQELTAGVSVGQIESNKQLLNLYKQSNGELAVIQNQYHVSYDEAKSMVDLAQQQNDEDEFRNKLQTANAGDLQKMLNDKYKDLHLSKEQAETIAGNSKSIEAIVKQEGMRATQKADAARKDQEEATRLEQRNKLMDDMIVAQKLLNEAKESGNKALIESAKGTVKDIEGQIEAIKPKDKEDAASAKKLNTVIDDLSKSQDTTAMLTGRKFDEMITRLSSIEKTIWLALGAGALAIFAKKFIDPKSLIQGIAKATLGGGGASGGGGGLMELAKDVMKGGSAAAPAVVAEGGAAAEAVAMGGGKLAGAVEGGLAKSGGGMLSRVGGMAGKFGKGLGFLSKIAKSPVGKVAGKIGIGKILTVAALAPSVYEAFKSGSVREGIATMLPSVMGVAGGALGGMAGAIGGLGVASAPLGIAGGVGGGMAGEWLGNKMADMVRGGAAPAPGGPGAAEPAGAVAQTPPSTPDMAGATGGPEMTFSGPLNADGSITVKFTNFMDAFGAAYSMSKKGMKPT